MYNRLVTSEDNPDGLSAKTIKNLHGTLHKAMKQAVMLGYIRSNPTEGCVLPRAEKREVTFLEEDDVLAAIPVQENRFKNPFMEKRRPKSEKS